MDVIFGEPEKNFTKLESFIEKKMPRKGTLIVIPELFLTGYHKESIDETATSMEHGEVLDRIIKIAQKYEVVIFGSIAENDSGKKYNTGVLVNKDGIVANYRKSHLFGPMKEKDLFSPGRSIVTASLNGINFGFSICYDLRFPTLYQKQAERGIEVILVVAEWPLVRVNHWSALLRARAIENQVFVIGLNRVGKDPDYEYGGHSSVFSPYGDLLFGLENSVEGSIQGTIDLNLVQEFRDKFDVRKDRW